MDIAEGACRAAGVGGGAAGPATDHCTGWGWGVTAGEAEKKLHGAGYEKENSCRGMAAGSGTAEYTMGWRGACGIVDWQDYKMKRKSKHAAAALALATEDI